MNIRRLQFTFFSLLISVTVFSYLFSKIDPAEVTAIIFNAIPSWLGLFVIFSVAMSVFRTWRYQLLLLSSGYRPGTAALFLITLVRNFFSDLLPARLGTLIYIYLIRSRLNIPLPAALSSFAYAFIFDILSLSLLLIPPLAITSMSFKSSTVVWFAGLGMLIASAAVLVFLPKCFHLAAKLCSVLTILPSKWRRRLHDMLITTEKHLVTTKKGGIYWKIFLLSFGVRICKYLSLYALLLGLVIPLGYTIIDFPFAKVFLGLASAELASSLPISGIAGFGAYEGAWALVFQLLGYPEKTALLTGISHHLVTQLYGYSLGGLSLLVLLLPVFNKQSRTEHTNTTVPGFWLKICALTLFLVFSVIMLVSAESKRFEISSNNKDSGQSITRTDSAVIYSADTLPGKIVFERPEGIYFADITKGIPRLLYRGGTYPRWSPDGKSVAFVLNNSIMLLDLDSGRAKEIAHADSARAVCFTAGGSAVLFTDGSYVRQVDLQSLLITDILSGEKFLEIDSSDDGRTIAATVKTFLGFTVRVYEFPDLTGRDVAKGCSASLSPDGRFITVNSLDHRTLRVYSTDTLQRKFLIPAPGGNRFDNQFWSNHPFWLVSTSDGIDKDIYVHNLHDGTYKQVTSSGHCDRADIFIPEIKE